MKNNQGVSELLVIFQRVQDFVEEELNLEEDPSEDLKMFSEMIKEVKGAAEKVKSDKDLDKLFLEYGDEIEEIFHFLDDLLNDGNDEEDDEEDEDEEDEDEDYEDDEEEYLDEEDESVEEKHKKRR